MATVTPTELNITVKDSTDIKSTDEEIPETPTKDIHIKSDDDCKDALDKLPPTPPLQASDKEDNNILKVENDEDKKFLHHESDDEYVELRPNYRVKKSQITSEDIESLIVKCTACRKQINHHDSHRVKRHPHLKVLICKECLDFYSSGEFSQDEDGDKYCRWCAQGGTLFGCDFCNNVFCNDCVRLNFGRGEARNISTSSDKWKCYMCDPQRLEEKINFCNLLYEYSKGTSSFVKKKTNKKPSSININDMDLDVTDPEKWLSAIIDNGISIAGKYKYQMEILKKKVHKKNKSTKQFFKKFEKISDELRANTKSNINFTADLYRSYVQQKVLNKSFDICENDSEININAKNHEIISNTVNGIIDHIDSHVDEEQNSSIIMNGCHSSSQVSEDADMSFNTKSPKTNVSGSSEQDEVIEKKEQSNSDIEVETSKLSRKGSRDSSKSKPIELSPTKNKTNNTVEQEVICLDSSDSFSDKSSVKTPKLNLDHNSKDIKKSNVIVNNTLTSKKTPKITKKVDKIDKENSEKKKEKPNKVDSKSPNHEKSSLESSSASSSSSSFDSSLDEKEHKKKKKVKRHIKSKNTKVKSTKNTSHGDSSSYELSLDENSKKKDNTEKISKVKSTFTKEEVAEWNVDKETILEKDIKLKMLPVVEIVHDLEIPADMCKILVDYYKTKEKIKVDDKVKSMEKSIKQLLTKTSKRKKSLSSEEVEQDSKQPSSKKVNSKPLKKKKMDLSSASDSFSLESSDSDASVITGKGKKEPLKMKASKVDSDDDSSGRDIEAIEENSKAAAKKPPKKGKTTSNSSESENSVVTIRDSGDDSDDDFVITKKSRKDDKLLRKANDCLKDKKNKKAHDKEKTKGKQKQKKRKIIYSDDSDKSSDSSNSTSDSSSSVVSDSDFESKKNKKKKGANKRKRVKMDNSSDENKSDNDDDEQNAGSQSTPGKGRKNIHKIISDKKLHEDTREAQIIEKERRRRVQERQKLYNCIVETENDGKDMITKKMVLEVDTESKEEVVEIHPDIVEKLKPHQINGVKFMWESTIESLKELEKKPGSGCILAHCMGLGKTLQVIAFLYTVLTNKHTSKKLHTAMIICPNNTVLNWANEFDSWLDDCTDSINVFEMVHVRDYSSRLELLKNWQNDGGVLIINYECFARLADGKIPKKTKQFKATVYENIADPGPDIVVCDEGHKLKNERSQLARSANKIKTVRRIILTGTPLQNNLKEYYCMMNFVKPSLLGTFREFTNRFVNPITNGQYDDSSKHDVKLMKKRVHILHKLLEGCVQRCDYSALTKFLPPKHEFVISVRLSEVQIKLYRTYLNRNQRLHEKDGEEKVDGRQIFQDYMYLKSIWTFPYALQLSYNKQQRAKMMRDDDVDDEGNLKDFINDDSSNDSSKNDDDDDLQCLDTVDLEAPGPSTRTRGKKGNDDSSGDEVIKSYPRGKASDIDSDENVFPEERQWFNDFFSYDDRLNPELGGKIFLTLEILKACESIGDKILIFSQSLVTLDIIEMFLKDVHDKTLQDTKYLLNDPNEIFQTWIPGIDYFRMEGKTHVDQRQQFMDKFNKKENTRARLFLISTKAGSLGTNLVGANRVILFDASWNPSDDVQSIFRVYRFGQEKPVYIYRFLAQGTMEEKIYNRQVTKLSMSCRVVDEQNIDRHFNQSQLAELYTFEPDTADERPTLMVPKDRLLADIIMSHRDWIVNFFEHDSLLQSTQEDDLTEEERQTAWTEYENEKEGLFQQWDPNSMSNSNANINMNSGSTNTGGFPGFGNAFNIQSAIKSICEDIKRTSPNISMYEFQTKLFSKINIMKAKCQVDHVSLLRQKQEYVSKGLQVPPFVNQSLDYVQLMMSQIDQSLTKIRQDLKTELNKVNQANINPPRFIQVGTRQSGPGFIRVAYRDARTGKIYNMPSQNAFTFIPRQQVPPPQQPATPKPPGPKIVDITEEDNEQEVSSSNDVTPIVTFTEENETNNAPSPVPGSSHSLKITEVE